MDRLFFHIKPEKVIGTNFTLDAEESHHLIHVLRKDIGTEIWLLNGIGTAYSAIIGSIENKRVSGHVLRTFPGYGENMVPMHLALAVLKGDRMKLAIEKATEMGVHSIIPLVLDRCIKRNLNTDRMKKIVASAAKQCARSRIPEIAEPITMKEWLQNTDGTRRLACTLDSNVSINALNKKKSFTSSQSVSVIIGPEGDFSVREHRMMRDEEIDFISLGSRRLRSETAVVSVLTIINELINT